MKVKISKYIPNRCCLMTQYIHEKTLYSQVIKSILCDP